jgi:1-phosphatidylinositol-4-phosphate 5-kinase
VETLDLQKNVASIKKAKESLGASGSFFFFSYDHRIVIKTIAEEEKDRFIEILPYYFDHVKYNENSLLARTYGIFSI